MSLMGEMKFFLGLQIHQSPSGIFINQSKYTLEILHKHVMDKGQSIGTPMATKPKLEADLSGNPVDQTDYHSKIRSLMYLTSSRPDIVQANRTAMSSTEAEYVALSASCAQIMWMRTQLQDYGLKYNKIPLYCDSQSAIAISCNPVQHSHTKHIHTRYHFIKEQVENGIIELYFVRTEYQLADMFTKALPEDRFKYIVRRIEAEYVALSASCAQIMWMRTQLQDYGLKYNKIPLYCDSQSAIAISCNPVQHSRTKHIHTRYHFIKEQVENGILELYFVRTEYQLADMFTKALPEDRFKYLVRRIDGNPSRAISKQALGRSYALSWKPYQGDSLNPPDHRDIKQSKTLVLRMLTDKEGMGNQRWSRYWVEIPRSITSE
nr:hypothetical protein [Tanacetum cinerariifolium]